MVQKAAMLARAAMVIEGPPADSMTPAGLVPNQARSPWARVRDPEPGQPTPHWELWPVTQRVQRWSER
jgi:hypothetical protein